MLVSVLTNNLEVSLNMTASEIKILDDVDMMLLRGAMLVSSKSSLCLLLLELGVDSIEFVIKKKRVLHTFHLLTTSVPSLAKNVFDEQVKNPSKGDFINLVMKDLKNLEINKSLDEFLFLSKPKFKSMVKMACKEACFRRLLANKQKLSKGKEASYGKFETQNHLKLGHGLSVQTMRRIDLIR